MSERVRAAISPAQSKDSTPNTGAVLPKLSPQHQSQTRIASIMVRDCTGDAGSACVAPRSIKVVDSNDESCREDGVLDSSRMADEEDHYTSLLAATLGISLESHLAVRKVM